ncbi:MAG: GTPase Era [Alphaproteobacteria bacterium]
MAEATHCGIVAIIGAPNAGKSTLVNTLVGAKVAIVTPKVQTTRSPVRGIAVRDGVQLVFIDTPGIFAPRRRLERAMVDAAWSGTADADVSLLVVDATGGLDGEVAGIVAGLAAAGGAKLLAINKVDAVKRERLLALSAALNEAHPFDATFMISALSGDGCDDLFAALARRMPEGPFLYPEDQLTDLSERLLAADVTREKAFLRLHDELPYALTVETENWKDFSDGSVRIDQTIYIARESHKPIVLGKGGRTIRIIREAAQAELAAALDRPVHLFIHVKVKPGWTDDPAHYRLWGLRWDA